MPNKTFTLGSSGNLVDINITGTLSGNGSSLTNLNASNLSSGTTNWNRLPTSRIYDATASRTANTFLAAPNGSAGAASFRTIASADLPNATASAKGAVIAGSGLTMSSATLNHASSITAGTVGTSSATSGSTLAVPYVTYNATGHITGVGTHTHTVSGFAASSHTHGAGDITSGTLAIGRIPTSSTQSNSNNTVPTSALVYAMNTTLSTAAKMDVWTGAAWVSSSWRLNYTHSSDYKFYMVFAYTYKTSGSTFYVTSTPAMFTYTTGTSGGTTAKIHMSGNTYINEADYTLTIGGGTISCNVNCGELVCIGFK